MVAPSQPDIRQVIPSAQAKSSASTVQRLIRFNLLGGPELLADFGCHGLLCSLAHQQKVEGCLLASPCGAVSFLYIFLRAIACSRCKLPLSDVSKLWRANSNLF